MTRTTPRHAGASPGRRARALAWVGVREVFVFAAVGLALPVAVLVTLPRLFDGGTAMAGAPTCLPNGPTTDCLAASPTTVDSSTDHRLGSSARVGDDELRFAEDQPRLTDGEEVHVLRWDGTAVAVRRSDGSIVESLAWGPTLDVDTAPLVWAPAWSLGAAAAAVLVFRRRHPVKVAVLGVVAAGTAAAGPLALVGLHLQGYDGLVLLGLGTLGITLIAAGGTLAGARHLAARDARRRIPQRGARRSPEVTRTADARLPEQREHQVSASPAPRP